MIDSDRPKPLNKRWLVGVSSTGIALLCAAVVLHFAEVDTFWQDMLLHLGAGFALSGVLFFFDRKFEHVSQHIAKQTREGLRAIDERLDQRLGTMLAQQEASDQHAAETFSVDGTYAALHALLCRAMNLGTISKLGIRTAIPNTPLQLRVCPSDDAAPVPSSRVSSTASPIMCAIEKSDRTEVASFLWTVDANSDETFLTLHDLLSQAGQSVSQKQFLHDSSDLREALAETLRVAIDSRTGDDASRRTMSRIFQRIDDDWFVTAAGLEQLSTGYRVTVEQLRTGRVVQAASYTGTPESWQSVVSAARDAWRPNEWVTPFW